MIKTSCEQPCDVKPLFPLSMGGGQWAAQSPGGGGGPIRVGIHNHRGEQKDNTLFVINIYIYIYIYMHTINIICKDVEDHVQLQNPIIEPIAVNSINNGKGGL